MDNQAVQIQYLLSKIKGLLEAGEQYFQSQECSTEQRVQIRKALNAIESLPYQFDKN